MPHPPMAVVDPTAIDPLTILASIAVNENLPAVARVQACKELLRSKSAGVQDGKSTGLGVNNAVVRRALAGLSAGRPN